MPKTITPTRPIADRIRAANTSLTNALAVKDRLIAYAAPTVNVDDDFRDRLNAGADPADLVDDYVTAKSRQNAIEQYGRLVRDVLQRVVDPRPYEQQFVDQALDMCRAELDDIMDRVADHRDLIEQHSDSAAALQHDRTQDWQTVEAILDDYDRLTAEYRRQVRIADPSLHGPTLEAVQCRDFLDVAPYWLHQRRTTSILETYPNTQIRGWFRDLPATRSYTRAEWILTVADHQPWLPNPDDLAHATLIAQQLCAHRWNTGTLGHDRTVFASHMANLRNITHNEPIPETKPAARRLA